MDDGPIFRPYTDKDLPFIFSSWINSYWHGHARSQFRSDKKLLDPRLLHVYRSAYYDAQKKIIKELFKDPEIATVVAAPPRDPDVVIGWCMMSLDTVHYVYVNYAFRRMGIATSLLDLFKQDVVICTHLTAKGRSLMARRESIFKPESLKVA